MYVYKIRILVFVELAAVVVVLVIEVVEVDTGLVGLVPDSQSKY